MPYCEKCGEPMLAEECAGDPPPQSYVCEPCRIKADSVSSYDLVAEIQAWFADNPHPVNSQAREAIYLLYRAHRELVRLTAEQQLITVEDARKIARVSALESDLAAAKTALEEAQGQIVPRVPTQAMTEAMYEAARYGLSGCEMWIAMYDAARSGGRG